MGSRLKGRRAVFVIAHEGYREEELELPRQALERERAEVVVASSSLGPATGMGGGRCQPDLLYCALDLSQFDAMIFVGGVGASEYFPDRTAHRLAQEAVREGKVLGAICFASSVLAEAGLLDGREATGFGSRALHLRAKGALYRDVAVVVAGAIVTGRGPEDAAAFGQALVDALATE